MATLDLNTAPETAVLRAFERILKCDPTLKRVVKVWRTWQEKPGQNPPFGIAQVPPGQVAIRITPTNGPDEWLFPGTFKGAVYLHFECLIQGGDADDPRLSAPQAAEETREVEPAAAQGLEPKLIRFDPELN